MTPISLHLPSAVLFCVATTVSLYTVAPAFADGGADALEQGAPVESAVPVDQSIEAQPAEPAVPVDQSIEAQPAEPAVPVDQTNGTQPDEPAIPAEQSNEDQPADASPPSDAAPEATAETRDKTPSPDAARRVSRELTADLVYAVLVGEIAKQRGNLRMALTHYLHAAKLSADPAMAELAAHSALTLEDPDATRRAISVWLELAPESLSAHQIAAYTLLDEDDIDGAVLHLRRVIELSDAGDKDGFMLAAGLVAKVKPEGRRLDLMRALVADQPDNADAHHAFAMVAASVEHYDEAIAATRRALELRPDWDRPRVFLVRLLLAQDKRQEAREVLEGFVAADPENHGLHMLYAQLLVEDKEFARARTLFERMLGNKPKDPDVLFAAGILSLQLDDYDAARDYFTRLYSTGQRADDAAFYLGQVEQIGENNDAAIDWYAKVKGENRSDAQVHIARIRAEQGNVARAREILQQLRDGSSDDVVTLYLLEAEILKEIDRNEEVMGVYDVALEELPGNADLLYARALYAVTLDELDILERDLRAILDEDPEHADALNALGYTLADRTERFAEAKGYIEQALALKPNDPAVLDSMGWVLYRLGRNEEALVFLRRAVELLTDGEISAHLGQALWDANQREEAWAVWEAARAEDPEHEYLLRVIERHSHTEPTPDP